MDSFKLLAVLLLINLTVAISVASYNEIEREEERIGNYVINADKSITQFYSDKAMIDYSEAQTDYQYEKTAGNTIEMGSLLMETFKEGIKPWSINKGQFTDTPSRAIADIIMYFRLLLMLAIALEILFIIKNRKTV